MFFVSQELMVQVLTKLCIGLPCAALDVLNSPEIVYFKDGKNGFIAKTKIELGEKIQLLLNDKLLNNKFSKKS